MLFRMHILKELQQGMIVYMSRRTRTYSIIFFYWKSLLSHSNSFYRNDFDKKKRDFFGGIERNLQRIQTDFPGSVMRLYYQVPNESLFLQTACKLACTVPNFDLCDVERIPSMGKHISFFYLFIP